MIGTLFSLIAAGLIIFSRYVDETSLSSLSIVMLSIAVLFLLFVPIGIALSWLPLQKAEQNTAPRILGMYLKDRIVGAATGWLIVFPIATILLAVGVLSTYPNEKKFIFAIWIVLLGLAADAVHHWYRKVLEYLNPFSVAKMFTKNANQNIQNERELDLCNSIDGLSEVAIKAIQRHSISLSNSAISEQQQIARLFLQASKSISHHTQDKQTKELGISDKVSYVMFYLYQRLDLEFQNALKNNLEPVCSHIIVSLGKIALDAATYDISMASPPLRFLGKFAAMAQDKELTETVIKASCTSLEAARALLTEVDITYLDIKDPFLSIINTMEELAKGAFRKDKTSNIALLVQPFQELKSMFADEKIKQHQDTPFIVQNIDRVIGEFDALQMVMNTLPTIPTGEQEEKSITPPPAS